MDLLFKIKYKVLNANGIDFMDSWLSWHETEIAISFSSLLWPTVGRDFILFLIQGYYFELKLIIKQWKIIFVTSNKINVNWNNIKQHFLFAFSLTKC